MDGLFGEEDVELVKSLPLSRVKQRMFYSGRTPKMGSTHANQVINSSKKKLKWK